MTCASTSAGELTANGGACRGDAGGGLTRVALRLLRNIIHGSDTLENAKMEIDLWFKPEEFVTFTPCAQTFIYE